MTFAGEKTCTLAWIWNHATEEERTACENLLKTKNVENTLHADAMKVPTEVKNATSPAPPAVANAARGRGADATGQPAAGGAGPDPQPDTGMTGTAGTVRAAQPSGGDRARALIQPIA